MIALSACIVTGALRPAGAQEQQATPARASARPSVVLRPGDRVRLRVWREPDLSGDFVVDEDGIVVFPMVGRIAVKLEVPRKLLSLRLRKRLLRHRTGEMLGVTLVP